MQFIAQSFAHNIQMSEECDLTTILHQYIYNITMGLVNFVENTIEHVIIAVDCFS